MSGDIKMNIILLSLPRAPGSGEPISFIRFTSFSD
jgi:hypothetical protein